MHRIEFDMKRLYNQFPNLMNLSRGLNPQKPVLISRQKLKLKNWLHFLVEPNIFERPLKFKPPLKFIK
jgi:hypothetical protein